MAGYGAGGPVRSRPSRVALVVACGAASLSFPAAAGAPRYRFDLPAGPLSAGVAHISAQARVTIVAADPTLLSTNGPALRVDGTIDEALSRLLEKTSARAIRTSAFSWRILARLPPRPVPHPRSITADPAATIDVVVIGSKHNVALSAYPASIAMIDGAALSRFGATPDTNAIARIVPAVQSTHLGPGRDKLFLRGIADSSFNGSSAALVGVYVNDVRLNYNAPDPDLRLYDVERVEVLMGPQGTLYGAGSMAGLIRITPRAPDLHARAGEVWVGGTSVAHGALGGDAGGIINVPVLNDRAALRLVGYAAHDGGYIDDAGRNRADVNATDTLGARATLRVRLGKWRLDMGAMYQAIRNRDAQYAERDLPLLTRASIAAQPSANLFQAGYVTVAGEMGEVDLTTTTALVGQRLRQSFLPDDGNVGTFYRQRDDLWLLSEEVRLSSRAGAALGWTVGLSALDGRSEQIRTNLLGGFDRSLGRALNDLTELTGFGELTAYIVPRLTLTAGGRVTLVRLGGVATGALEKGDANKIPADGEPHFVGVRHEAFAMPSLGFGWTPAANWLVFARFSEGYRPGGQTASGIIERYDADRIESLEAGIRLRPAGGSRVSAQVSAATSRWRHIQADVLTPDGLPATQNIGDGTVRSLSASLSWKPLVVLEAKLAATLAEGVVTRYDIPLEHVIRSSLPNVAHDTLAASLDYRRALGAGRLITAGVSLNHVGRSVLGSDSMLAQVKQGGYWLASTGADLRLGAGTVSIDIDNLLDSAANSFAFGTPSYAYTDREITPLRPRTIRLGLRRSF
jgi:iron complex outermembrane receptor protein